MQLADCIILTEHGRLGLRASLVACTAKGQNALDAMEFGTRDPQVPHVLLIDTDCIDTAFSILDKYEVESLTL